MILLQNLILVEMIHHIHKSKKHMNPHFLKNDLIMFYKHLNNATNYFEFGSGGSTYQSSIKDNIKKIYSVESDPIWVKKVRDETILNKHKIEYIFCEMKTLPHTWGRPGVGSTLNDWKNYSNSILNKENIDFLLIDGRFRVACCLKSFECLRNSSKICFDDFLNRKNYHVVLDYFEIIEHTSDNCMVILQKKSNVLKPSKELIEQYEKIMD